MGTQAVMGKQVRVFAPARRVNEALTAGLEKRALQWMARRMPGWVGSDHLTALGFLGQMGAAVGYALAHRDPYFLLVVIACLALNWFGDSMDGTVARVRCQQRPRYGFYVDHMVDVFGAVALMTGLGLSGFVHWPVAIGMLIAFLLLACESYLATYTLGQFQLSQGMFGPTEIRILLIVGNLVLLHSPFVTVLGHRWLLFDVGGTIAMAAMLGMAVRLTAKHTAQLYREEPLV